MIAIVAGLLIATAAMSQRTDRTEARYRQDADAALAAEDFRTARVCFERLLQTSPNDNALLLGLAQSLQGLGQSAESAQILQRLAPLQGAPGYAPAHLWIARQLLSTAHDPKSLAISEAHLRCVLNADPVNADARSLLDRLYANTGRAIPLQ